MIFAFTPILKMESYFFLLSLSGKIWKKRRMKEGVEGGRKGKEEREEEEEEKIMMMKKKNFASLH